jgi:hypothetical protein
MRLLPSGGETQSPPRCQTDDDAAAWLPDALEVLGTAKHAGNVGCRQAARPRPQTARCGLRMVQTAVGPDQNPEDPMVPWCA